MSRAELRDAVVNAHALVRRVGFLVGDADMDVGTVTELLGARRGEVIRIVREYGIERGQPLFAEWPLSTLRDVAEILGFDAPDLGDNEDEWPLVQFTLHTRLPPALRLRPDAWPMLDKFLANLRYRIDASGARLTTPRLEFLHGDLCMTVAEIATLLDAPRKFVVAHLDGIEEGHRYHPDLTAGELHWLPWMLGRSEWPRTSSTDTSDAPADWQDAHESARDGLLALGAAGMLDPASLDGFIADIPKLVENRRRGRGAEPQNADTTPVHAPVGEIQGRDVDGDAPPPRKRSVRTSAAFAAVALLVAVGAGCSRTTPQPDHSQFDARLSPAPFSDIGITADLPIGWSVRSVTPSELGERAWILGPAGLLSNRRFVYQLCGLEVLQSATSTAREWLNGHPDIASPSMARSFPLPLDRDALILTIPSHGGIGTEAIIIAVPGFVLRYSYPIGGSDLPPEIRSVNLPISCIDALSSMRTIPRR